ncbi:MAG: N-acetylmuramoyl-L-alanine amidase [Acidobacteriota bacterium]|nr:N-acetylmuramoyl-L-alanine amidase [Acidobacteriota bacterium]
MDEIQTLKSHLLRQAVRENVDVITGRYRFKRRSKSSQIHFVARAFFFMAVPLALFFSSYLIASVAGSWLEGQSAKTTAIALEGVGDTAESATAPEPRPGAKLLEVQDLARLDDDQVAALAAAPSVDAAAFPLDVRRIIVDPGHGGENRGTEAPSGLIEKEIALDIAMRLRELLDTGSFEVELTRQLDEFVSLEDRALFANSRRGDLFISIHLNWIETQEVRGVETYYLGPTNDPYLTQLAAEENRDSGYSLADFRGMLDRVYANVRQTESRRLAAAVQQSLYNSLRRVNPRLQDRGVKKAPFIVLTGTEMPAILAEVSCLSNEREARLLMTPGYRQYIAEALFEGIDTYAQQVSGLEQTGS